MEHRIIRILLCSCVIFLFTSCGTKSSSHNSPKTPTVSKAKYDISLIDVERSVGNSELPRKPKIEKVIEKGVVGYSFEDETVKMIWRGMPVDIVFTINNKTDHPIKIAWNESRFIDMEGTGRRLNHSGIGYEERNLSQPPTIIAAGSKLEDFIHPADYFHWIPLGDVNSDKKEGYWDRAPFLPTQIKGTAKELKAKTDTVIGKTFRVILPLEIKNVRIEYICTFKIDKADVTVNEEKEKQMERNANERKEDNRRRKPPF